LKMVEDHVEDFRRAVRRSRSVERPQSKIQNPKSKIYFLSRPSSPARRNEMRAMQEETFGPTLPIATSRPRKRRSVCERFRIRIDASVWTRDYEKADALRRRSKRLRLRQRGSLHARHRTDAVGRIQNSGRGRTHGTEGLMELVQPQHIHVIVCDPT
jgi:acyl-CoA reductase-like NAD-dependent aldehyde dehydrogenase